MRTLSILLSVGALALVSGCSHTVERAEAHYYQNRADSAAAHGDYYKAAREQYKSDRAAEKAEEAPLP